MHPIVFYDGICGLCNRSVKWLVKHDRRKTLRYASLQSTFAENMLASHGLDISSGTIVFMDHKTISIKSDAVINILIRMKGPYQMACILRVIPRRLRDAVYDWVAKIRYKWFGKYDTCPIPDAGTRELFLDEAEPY